VLVVGGCAQTPGAVILAGLAALRVGAGVLQIASSESVAPGIALAVPEARVVSVPTGASGRWSVRGGGKRRADAAACDALLIGPGMPRGSGAAVRAWVTDSLAPGADTRAIIVDAGALDLFSAQKPVTAKRAPAIILTPHPGEMATLWSVTREQVLADAPRIAAQAAATLNAIVVLKGARTLVAAPDGRLFYNREGNPGLGTSGSGDVLAGVIAGLCARGADPVQAAVWGVVLHARSGDRLATAVGPLGFLARELLDDLPRVLAATG
jgi:ADP-dependent NAD(P)H-hydrate dehydratase